MQHPKDTPYSEITLLLPKHLVKICFLKYLTQFTFSMKMKANNSTFSIEPLIQSFFSFSLLLLMYSLEDLWFFMSVATCNSFTLFLILCQYACVISLYLPLFMYQTGFISLTSRLFLAQPIYREAGL